MYTPNILLSAALLLSTCSAAPVEQQPLENQQTAPDYPYKNDPYDRKHDTYGDDVQPRPVVRSKRYSPILVVRLTKSSAMDMVQVF